MIRARTVAVAVAAAALAGACRETPRLEPVPAATTDIEQRQSPLTALSRTGWTASASTTGGTDVASRAIDGTASTRWRAGAAQATNQWFQVDMASLRTFAEIRLDTTGTPNEYPRNYRVQVANDNTSWGTVPNVATGTGTTAVTTIAFAPQTARYIRVTLTGGNAAFWSIHELNVYGTALSRTGWTATASSTSGTNVPANALDGNTSTRWSTSGAQTSQWFKVDMKSPRTFNQVILDAGTTNNNFPRGYSVVVSNDDVNWSAPVATGTGTTAFIVITFPFQHARYVRIDQTATNSTTWSIQELNVEGQPTGQLTQPRVGWIPTASSTNGSNVPANAIDGSTTTRWTSAGAQTGQSFRVDMLVPRIFDQITLDAGTSTNNFPRGYQVEISNDATNWTSVASGSNSSVLLTITLTPARTARHIRINQTATNSNPWSIQEMNVTGPALTTPGWVATASSNSTGNVPGNAIDGSTSTRWSTAGAQTNQSFTVDMGTAQVFNQLTLDAGSTTSNNYPRAYSVFVSNDGTNFGNAIASGTGSSRLVTITFATQTARFVRIIQTATNSTTWSIEELNVWRIALCDQVTCAASDQCHVAGVCDPATGACSNPNAPNDTACNDNNACTQASTCQSGACTGTNPVVCTAQDQCHVAGTCNPATGICTNPNAPNDTACNDNNACTQGDVCTGGTCQGPTNFTCGPPDQCHEAGTCNIGTAPPEPPSMQDLIGWWKLDGNGNDSSGGNHTLTNEGAVPAPGRFGLGMKFDGSSCMTAPVWNEARMQGANGVTMMAWIRPDSAYTCSGQTAQAVMGKGWDYSAGAWCYPPNDTAPVVGARPAGAVTWGYPGGGSQAPVDQWTHVALVWDRSELIIYQNGQRVISYPNAGDFGDIESTFAIGCQISYYFTGDQRILFFHGAVDEAMLYRRVLSATDIAAYWAASSPCTYPTKPNDTACNDSNLCTQTDTCQGGTCTGSNPVVCTALDTCHVAGVCNPANGACSNPAGNNGAACNDNDVCTNGTTCQNGACVGGTPVTCTVDQCHAAGACNPATGCPLPRPNDTPCDDGDPCTTDDVCTAGDCRGPNTFTCVARNDCHTAGTCNIAHPPAPPPSQQDLIGWWKLEGNGEDETAGNHDLENEGAVETQGRIGKAMRFDGTACMQRPIWDEARMQSGDGLTIMAWYKPDQYDCDQQYDPNTVVGRGVDYSLGAWCYEDAPSWYGQGVAGSVRTVDLQGWGYGGGYGTGWGWHHIAFTWDRQTGNGGTYLDGKGITGWPFPGQITDYDPFAVGCQISTYWGGEPYVINHFHGAVDEVMLYRRPLSGDEIRQYYDTANPCWSSQLQLANNTPCFDGSWCTSGDVCQAGTCAGTQPVVCTAPSPCHTPGTCYPWAGCVNPQPRPEGAACNDGQVCTQGETCRAGSCQASANPPPVVLNLPVDLIGDLGGTNASGADINSRGDVVGSAATGLGDTHAFLRPAGGTIADLGIQYTSAATAINDAGVVIGSASQPDGWHVFRRDPVSLVIQDLGRFGDGTVSSQDIEPIQGAQARDINSAGQIVGNFTQEYGTHGFRYTEGAASPFEDIGSLAGRMTYAMGIDDNGTVVGSSWVPTASQVNDVRRLGEAVMFQEPVVGIRALKDLIDPMLGWTLHQATDIAGEYIVGTGEIDGILRPFRLRISNGEVLEMLEISGGWQGLTLGNGVNRFGDVVGWGYLDGQQTQVAAFVYSDRFGFKKLNDIIDPGAAWDLRTATAINDLGEIVGSGVFDGEMRAFRLSIAPQAVACGSTVTCGGPSGAICLWSDGVVDLGGGQYLAVFGYASSAATSVRPNTNEVWLGQTQVSNPQPKPPQWFAPGTHSAAFLPTFQAGETIIWKVDGQTASASVATSTRLLTKVPIGSNGYGVMLGGRLLMLKPDVPQEPTRQNDPPLGAAFNGALAGELTVGPSGAATYKVPIGVPPGIAGMAPSLSLSYSSQGGNGIAGHGWQLGGMSLIHRCPKSRLKDGKARPIEMSGWTEEDPRSGDVDPRNAGGEVDGVCLDGMRLFERESGRYEGENKDFSWITRSTDYTTFKVVTKSGETRYYGSSDKSRIRFTDYEGDQGRPELQQLAVWALDRVEDVWGNYYTVTYNDDAEDWADRGVLITRIDYTGHAGADPSDDQGTFHSIIFGYETRPDVRTMRFRNSRLPVPFRISTITTAAGKYWFTYLPDDDPMLPSRLGGIDYCGGPTCPADLPPTPSARANAGFARGLTFEWEGGEYAWEENPSALAVGQANTYQLPLPIKLPGGSHPGTQLVDLNGDGRPDFVQAWKGGVVPNQYEHVWKNNGRGWSVKDNWRLPEDFIESHNGERISMQLADMDGDGLVDIITSYPAGPPTRVWYNRIKYDEDCAVGQCWELREMPLPTAPTGVAPYERPQFVTTVSGAPGEPIVINQPTHFIGDMDGDGRADLIGYTGSINPPRASVLLNKPSGWVETTTFNGAGRPVDLNRDGLADSYTPGEIGEDGLPGSDSCAINHGPDYRPCPTCILKAFPRIRRPCGLPTPGAYGADVDGDGLLDNTFMGDVDVTLPITTWNGQCPPTEVKLMRSKTSFSVGNGTANWGSVGDELEYQSHVTGALFPMNTDICADPGAYSTAEADLNADGLADLILTHPSQSGQQRPGQLLVNRGSHWADLNGATTFQRYISGPKIVPRVPNDNSAAGAAFLDLNGDGVTDIVQSTTGVASDGLPNVRAYLNKFRPPVIKQFPNGLAAPTTVFYKVIATTDAQIPGGVYQETRERAAGTTFLMTPLRVVQSVLKDDGLGHGTSRVTTYQYEDLRGNPAGFGPQGFRRVTVKETAVDDTYATKTVTTYAQAPPYTGMPTSIEKIKESATASYTLQKTTTGYCDSILEVGGVPQCQPITTPETSQFVYPIIVRDIAYLFHDYTQVGEIQTVTEFRHDNWGNPIRNTITTTKTENDLSTGQPLPIEVHIKELINVYGTVDSTEQKMGKLTSSTVTTRKIGGPSSTHETRFDYGAVGTTLALKKKLIEPGKGVPLEMHTAYAYDGYGNVVTTTDCASDFGSCDQAGAVNPEPPGPDHPPFRTTTTSYDPAAFSPPPPQVVGSTITSLGYTTKGRFPVKTTNLLNESEYHAYDPVLGLPLQKTDPNGFYTRWLYDAYGRQTMEIARAGSTSPINTTTQRLYVATGDPPPAITVAVTYQQSGETTWAYADPLGRTVATRSRAFDGGFTKTLTEHDALGRVVRASKPFPESAGPSYYTTTHYDGFGRVDSITDELGVLDDTGTQRVGKISTKFRGSTVMTQHKLGSNEEQQPRWETKNAIGQTVVVKDAKLTRLIFKYDADGNLTDAGDPSNGMLPTVHVEFDDRGRKILSVDPDLGTSSYVYDGFGQLIEQADAKGQKTKLTYDQIGRLIRRTELADTPQAATSEWVYGSQPGEIGRLLAVVSAPDDRLSAPCTIPHATLTDGERTGRSVKYNPLGEIEEIAECVDGETFRTNLEYDSSGRQRLIRYPQVGGARMEVEYHYTQTGFLHYVRDPAADVVLWAATARNVRGQVTQEYTRNGVETAHTRNPSTGWLMGSSSVAYADGGAIIQSALYRFDELGNLKFRGREGGTSAVVTMEDFTYDELNRVQTARVQTSAGYNVTSTYRHDPIGNMTEKDGRLYSYIGCGGRPHAVCSIDGGTPFVYDANGNMTSGNSRTIEYNPNDKPIHIDSHPTPSQGNDTGIVAFIYGPEGHRVVQSVGTYPSTELARTIYVGMGGTGKSLYERTTRGTTVEHVQFIYAGGVHGGAAFALRVATEAPTTGLSETEKYYHFDHLGSVTAMSDETGHVVGDGPDAEVMAYDPWGARRNLNGTPATPASFNLPVGRREFTGHETIPNVGLVNMNGRVYDPLLGRFLSADPYVQAPGDLQSYNRYSYVLNNPLRYTDPTGYFVDGHGNSFDMMVGFTIAAVAAFACGYTGNPAACVYAAGFVVAIYNAASAANAGIPAGEIQTQFMISAVASGIGGVIGNGLGTAIGGFGGSVIGGAVSGAITAALTDAMMGRGISGWNILQGAAEEAFQSSVEWGGKRSRALSDASAGGATRGRASGATILENDATSEVVAGAGGPHDPIELGKDGNPILVEGPRTAEQHKQDMLVRKWLNSEAPNSGGRTVFEATAGKGIEYGVTKPTDGPLGPTKPGTKTTAPLTNHGTGKNAFGAHTHPPTGGSEFSNLDLTAAKGLGAPLYLGEPKGNLWVLDPIANTIMFVSSPPTYVPGTTSLPDTSTFR